jgi:hypothetical protein
MARNALGTRGPANTRSGFDSRALRHFGWNPLGVGLVCKTKRNGFDSRSSLHFGRSSNVGCAPLKRCGLGSSPSLPAIFYRPDLSERC